jgi:hypothetical protein
MPLLMLTKKFQNNNIILNMKKIICSLLLTLACVYSFAAITITPATVPNGNIQHPYAQTLQAIGGSKPFTWTTNGTLPTGLTLLSGTTSTANLSGTPTAAGVYTFSVTVTDSKSVTARNAYTVTITQIVLTPTAMTNAWYRQTPGYPTLWDTWNTLSGVYSTGWSTTGNSGTVAGTNFLGTTDNIALVFKVNNKYSGVIEGSTQGFNTGIGSEAFLHKSSGTGNTTMGGQSSYSITTGSFNSAFGFQALANNKTGSYNTSTANGSLTSCTNCSANTGVGVSALYANVSGYGNTAVGYDAGRQTTGSNNIFLGDSAGFEWLGSNRLFIGNLVNDSVITADLANKKINLNGSLKVSPTATSYTASASVTAGELGKGILTVSSGTCTLTLPTASALATNLGVSAGTYFDFVVTNTASGGTATVAVNTGIVAVSAITGGTTLTLANSSTQGVAMFRITFISSSAAILSRLL